jgi:hypothetical protein
METHGIMPVSQIFKACLSGGIDKSISPDLLTLLLPYPPLHHKRRVFMLAFLQKPFHNKNASPRTNLATLVNLEHHISVEDTA